MTLVAAIALLWAIGLLSLAATLPQEFWATDDGHRDRETPKKFDRYQSAGCRPLLIDPLRLQ